MEINFLRCAHIYEYIHSKRPCEADAEYVYDGVSLCGNHYKEIWDGESKAL